MLISIDCEATGLDWVHGAKPFLVTTCSDSGEIKYWEWDVNPLTRQPQIPQEDLSDIAELLDAADLIYMQNSKYDAHMLATIGIDLPWHKVRDTLVMGHLLASNHPHDLTWMCKSYLDIDIEPYEIAMREVTRACRKIVKRDYPKWRIAEDGDPDMPSVKGSSNRDEDKPWKNDMWLSRTLAKELGKINSFRLLDIPDIPNKNWLDACSKYANADSEHTLTLGLEMERQIRERGYWVIYEHRLHLMRVACEMESYGVTAIGEYTESTIKAYAEHVAEEECELVSIAAGYGHNLELAAGASTNDNMREFFYGSIQQTCPCCGFVRRVKHWNGDTSQEYSLCPKCEKGSRKRTARIVRMTEQQNQNLELPIIYSKKSGNACLDKNVMHDYLTTTDGDAYDFVKLLTDKRKHDTDLTYMRSYQRFWVPVPESLGYYRIHPSLNPCATDHLRWASNSPNLQNVGKQEDECEECDGEGCGMCNGTGKSRVSVRRCFGPAPGREWYTMDYESIENRLPPYECVLMYGSGDEKMLEVFEKPNEPPYWGNLYLLNASVLYPDEFWPLANDKGRFKAECPKLYKKSKFFLLAKQYGCGRGKGDLLSGVRNSFSLVDQQFPQLARLQQHYLRQAESIGYVETIPDRTVDPTRGYPILASRTDDGRVLSTTPFNYHISGSACWAKNKALIRCSAKLAEWRAEGFDGHMALEIHDEILFDFPRGKSPEANRDRAIVLRGLMEESGRDFGIPLPVSAEYHAVSWAEGIPIGGERVDANFTNLGTNEKTPPKRS